MCDEKIKLAVECICMGLGLPTYGEAVWGHFMTVTRNVQLHGMSQARSDHEDTGFRVGDKALPCWRNKCGMFIMFLKTVVTCEVMALFEEEEEEYEARRLLH